MCVTCLSNSVHVWSVMFSIRSNIQGNVLIQTFAIRVFMNRYVTFAIHVLIRHATFLLLRNELGDIFMFCFYTSKFHKLNCELIWSAFKKLKPNERNVSWNFQINKFYGDCITGVSKKKKGFFSKWYELMNVFMHIPSFYALFT